MNTTFGACSKTFLIRLTPLYWAGVFAAYVLLSRDWAVVRATSTTQEHLFGLFGLCVFFAILYAAYTDYRSLSAPSLRNLILIGIPFLVCLFMLAAVAELSQKSWDYKQYEAAFRAAAAGDNPYRSTRYLYPPFFAETMIAVYRLGGVLLPWIGMETGEASLWMFVFYIHQCALLFALLCSYHLSLRFAETAGLNPLTRVFFVSGLFLFNVPVLRTILYNQVNFYILVSLLLPVVALNRRPFLSGAAIAAGGLIKLYPFALVAPLLATQKWKVLTGVLAGCVFIVALGTNLFRDLTLWKQFILFYLSFPVERESAWFRNSSILSFLRNLLEILRAPDVALTPLFGLVAILILGWIALRFFQRERLYAPPQADSTPAAGNVSPRDIGHLMDFSVLSLLIAPSAWEHHYVLAIPLAIWAFALSRKTSPGLLVVALTFVFIMPVFNVFPLSYLRTAGLILLLVLTSPKKASVG
jgi:hypothetical protein